MDLLSAQFNSGPLSLEEIKTVLGNDFAVWGALSKKFKQTAEGLFFNERLEIEKAKRKAYSASRKKNLEGKKSDMNKDINPHMDVHMENENEIENTLEFKEREVKEGKRKKQPKVEIEIILPFNSDDFIRAWGVWKQYKKEQYKFTYKSVISEQAALKDLSEMSYHDECMAIELINNAIAKGWKGIYESNLKNGNKQRKNGQGATNEDLARLFAEHFASDYKQ